jgi:Cu/Ag efflux pump CusA
MCLMMTPFSIGIPRIETASGSDRRGLLPIKFGGGTDSEVTRRIAAPMIGSMTGVQFAL